ncbi:phosphoribosylformylglycinamidine cyclo-ligase chloroplastic/mitochondrial-like, partial [Trifolium pratense]
MLALETGILDTIGIDLVAMSVNDVVTSGTKPL